MTHPTPPGPAEPAPPSPGPAPIPPSAAPPDPLAPYWSDPTAHPAAHSLPPDPAYRPDPYQPAAYPAYPLAADPYRPDPYLPQPYGPPAGPYGYGAPYGYPGQPPRRTEGLAIASLVISCVSVGGLCTWGVGALLGVLGAILGHVARRRIRTSGTGGDGLALAGIIVGWLMAAIGILLITLLVVLVVTTEDTGAA